MCQQLSRKEMEKNKQETFFSLSIYPSLYIIIYNLKYSTKKQYHIIFSTLEQGNYGREGWMRAMAILARLGFEL